MSINLETIKKLDKQNMYGSIKELFLQCEQVFDEWKSKKIPADYKKIQNIVVSGMGGSGLGAHIIKSIFKNELKFPVEIINSYHLPAYVNQNTLLIISSYSGNTEEILAVCAEGRKRGAEMFIIASGGKLKKIAEKQNIPSYIFNPKHNSCGEPRMGLGYSIFSQLLLLRKIKIIKIDDIEIKKIINNLIYFSKKFSVNNENNPALIISKKIKRKIPVIVASEFLAGNSHTLSNQMNENAKNFSSWFSIPEICHHLLEGLLYPESIRKNLFFIFFVKSNWLHSERNQFRYKITQQVLKKNKIDFIEYNFEFETELSRSFEMLILGSYISFYLAILNNLNPSPIPNVDFFKEELGKYSDVK